MASSVPDGFPASAAEWTAAAPARVSTRWVTEAGRAALVWAPCYAIMGPRFSAGVGFAAATLLASVWLVSLRSAVSAVHLTLGIPIRCAVGTATGFVGASALALWVPGLGMAGWTILALAVAVFTLTTTWELVAQRVVSKRRVLVVGPSATAAEIAEVIQLEGGLPFVVVGAVDDEPGDTARLGSIAELSRIIDELRPDLIVLTDGESSARALDRLLAAPTDGIKVIGLAHFFDHAFGRVPLDGLTPTWFMSILHVWRRPYTRLAKRTFDIASASFGLLLSAPLCPVIALFVRHEPGPVIYRQTRVGEGGQHFTMLKFRTMRADAEAGGAGLHRDRRCARHARRPRAAPDDPPRRAAAALERAQGRDVRRRPAARAAGVHPHARGGDPVLLAAPADQAGRHRLGPAAARLLVGRGRRGQQALLRPLVPAPPQPPRRPRDLRQDVRPR